ncbi:alpha/beta fold hydrolase [Microbispora amethystogenes]|uniref:thioesterase II family protein n=1 Tax=Microbispora amethystogenes TaxID=1427754 RepID=UPI0033DFBB6D
MGAPRRLAPALRLFCLPYAGGSAATYVEWQTLLPDDVEICPVELPGRRSRWHEGAFSDMEPLVDALVDALAGELDRPYALFGHSMGALVAFELARALRRTGLSQPRTLFVSAGHAPQLPQLHAPIHDQSDEQVVARLRAMGGLTDEICSEPELLDLLLPFIRADFTVVETYRYRAEPPLACPIVAFAGAEDQEVPPSRMDAWEEQTAMRFAKEIVPGGHFFLRESWPQLVEMIRGALRPAEGRESQW